MQLQGEALLLQRPCSPALCSTIVMEESIYNLIPQPVAIPEQPPRYISKHAGETQPTWSTFGMNGTSKPGYQNVAGHIAGTVGGHHDYKKSYATMGKLGNAKHPADILKKGSGGGGGQFDYALATQSASSATHARTRA